jgi:hypothetical protein
LGFEKPSVTKSQNISMNFESGKKIDMVPEIHLKENIEKKNEGMSIEMPIAIPRTINEKLEEKTNLYTNKIEKFENLTQIIF